MIQLRDSRIVKVAATFLVSAVVVGGFLFWNYRLSNVEKPIGLAQEYTQAAAVFLGEEYKRFTHPDYGFSLEYPKELSVERYLEADDAEIIVFQGENSSFAKATEDRVGFQIFISPFGEDELLTKERILEDLPQAIIEEPLRVILNPGAPVPNRVEGLLFWSESPEIGKTREVWFTGENYLYEITTYGHLDTWLAKILSTWRFNTL